MLSKQLLSIFPPCFLLISKQWSKLVLSSSSEGNVQFKFSHRNLVGVYLILCHTHHLGQNTSEEAYSWCISIYVYCNGFLTLHNFALLSGRTWFIFTHHCKCCISPRFKSQQHRCLIGTGYKGAEREPLGTKHKRFLVPHWEHPSLAPWRSCTGLWGSPDTPFPVNLHLEWVLWQDSISQQIRQHRNLEFSLNLIYIYLTLQMQKHDPLFTNSGHVNKDNT